MDQNIPKARREKKRRRNSMFTIISQSGAELGFYEWVGEGGGIITGIKQSHIRNMKSLGSKKYFFCKYLVYLGMKV